MDKRYSRRGLVVVAPEVQGSTDEEIQDVIDEYRMKFTVTQGIQGPSLGSGIPRMAVFGVDGKLAFVGHPAGNDATNAIRKELRKVTAADEDGGDSPLASARLVENRSWTNADGAAVEAALVSVDGGRGTFIRPNGTTFVYDLTKLSDADQEVIAKAVEGEGEGEE
ncbi:hypothetical protein BH23VER1_BH23VER1_11200 [soil metagenome]